MSLWLRQSTAVTVKVGPFIDDTDFKTAETALAIAQADIRLTKNGGNIAQSSNSAGATHDELGQYDVPLHLTDTDTLGTLRVIIAKAGALQVWQDFMVVPAQVWDSYFGADKLQVHADEITAGLITAAAIATGAIDADAIADNAIDAGAIAADAITAAKIAPGAIDAATFAAGAITAAAIATNAIDADALATDAVTEIQAGLATSGAVAAVQADTDNIQSRLPAALVGGKMDSTGTIVAADIAAIADAVWDEALAAHLTAGSTGAALSAAGGAGDPWITPLPGAYAAGSAGHTLGTCLDVAVSSRATQASVDAVAAKTAALPPDPADASDVAAQFATVNATLAAVQADTDNLQTRLPAALVGGKMDSVAAVTLGPNAITGDTLDPTAIAEIVAGVGAHIVEGTLTLTQALQLSAAGSGGKTDGQDPGVPSTVHVRNTLDTKNRITASVDAKGNRTLVGYDWT